MYAECRYAECMLNVVRLNVSVLNVIMLGVVMPCVFMLSIMELPNSFCHKNFLKSFAQNVGETDFCLLSGVFLHWSFEQGHL
jgi:hypothetical protein